MMSLSSCYYALDEADLFFGLISMEALASSNSQFNPNLKQFL